MRDFHRNYVVVLWVVVVLMGLCFSAVAASKRIPIFDFEDEIQGGQWQANDGAVYSGSEAVATIAIDKDVVFEGVYSLKCTITEHSSGPWVSFQSPEMGNPKGSNWDPDGAFHIWIKGDGSGEEFTVMLLSLGIWPDRLISSEKIVLDSTDWKEYAIPFSSFTMQNSGQNLTDRYLWSTLTIPTINIAYDFPTVSQDVVFYIGYVEADVL